MLHTAPKCSNANLNYCTENWVPGIKLDWVPVIKAGSWDSVHAWLGWFSCEKSWLSIDTVVRGWKGHVLRLWPVDLHPLQVDRSWPCSRHAEQCTKGVSLCSNWLNIRPLWATRNRVRSFARRWARRSASWSRRRWRLIGSRIGGSRGVNSVLRRGRIRCQCGWKSAGVIASI